MTGAALLALHKRRKQIWGAFPAGDLRAMSADERAKTDRLAAEFRAAGAEIVLELKSRGEPVQINGSRFTLNADRDGYGVNVK